MEEEKRKEKGQAVEREAERDTENEVGKSQLFEGRIYPSTACPKPVSLISSHWLVGM